MLWTHFITSYWLICPKIPENDFWDPANTGKFGYQKNTTVATLVPEITRICKAGLYLQVCHKRDRFFLRNGCFNAVQDYPGMVSTMEINRLWNLSGVTDLWSVRRWSAASTCSRVWTSRCLTDSSRISRRSGREGRSLSWLSEGSNGATSKFRPM